MLLQKRELVLYIVAIMVVAVTGVLVSVTPIKTFLISVTLFVTITCLIFININFEKSLSYLSLTLIPSLLLIPGFTFNNITLRVDDFLVIFLGLSIFLIWYNKKELLPKPISTTLVAYLVYSSGITLIFLIQKIIDPIYLLFFLKEIQYFIYFAIFCYLSSKVDGFSEKVKTTFLIVSVITIFWGLLQIVSGNIRGYYGVGIISAPTASQSGIAFLLTTFVLLYISVTAKKKATRFIVSVMTCLSAILTLATVTRTSIVVLGVLFVMYLFFSMLRKKWNFIKIYLSIWAIVIIIPLGYYLASDLFHSILERFSRFGEGAEIRMNIWDRYLVNIDLINLIFGSGKGFMQVMTGTFVLKADNQFVRLIVEVGYTGLILWLIFIFSIVMFGVKNLKSQYTDSIFLLMLTLCFLTVGLTQEAYMVTIQASLYWILTGFFVGKMLKQNQITNT